MFDNIQLVTDLFFKNNNLNKFISRSWIYEDKCFVIDFYYRGAKFAFTLTPKNTNLFELIILNRRKKFNIIPITNNTSRKEVLLDDADLSFCLETAKEKINELIKKVDALYPYDVSVIVPIYNREKIIPATLESLNKQTLDKNRFEIIFVDDHSTDGSISVVETHIDQKINYRIIRREIGSGNPSAPRNEGIKAAKGRYVFFIDSDDLIDKDLLKNGIQIADKNDSDIVYFKIIGDKGLRETPIRPYKVEIVNKADISKHHLFRSLAIFKFFRLSMLQEHSILFNPSITVAEDKLFMVHALTVAERVSILADKVYYVLCFHGGEHLFNKNSPIEEQMFVYGLALNNILLLPESEINQKKLYNAWLVICMERMESLYKNRKKGIEKLELFFKILTSMFNIRSDLVDPSLVYKSHQKFISPFMGQDSELFSSLANDDINT